MSEMAKIDKVENDRLLKEKEETAARVERIEIRLSKLPSVSGVCSMRNDGSIWIQPQTIPEDKVEAVFEMLGFWLGRSTEAVREMNERCAEIVESRGFPQLGEAIRRELKKMPVSEVKSLPPNSYRPD